MVFDNCCVFVSFLFNCFLSFVCLGFRFQCLTVVCVVSILIYTLETTAFFIVFCMFLLWQLFVIVLYKVFVCFCCCCCFMYSFVGFALFLEFRDVLKFDCCLCCFYFNIYIRDYSRLYCFICFLCLVVFCFVFCVIDLWFYNIVMMF